MNALGKSLLAAGLVVASAALAQAPARARTDSLIAAFKKLPPGPARGNDKAFGSIDTFVDIDAIVSEAIGPRAAKFKPAELAEFKTRFRELIRTIAYPNAGEFFREAQLRFGKVEAEGPVTKVPLTARLPKEDLETEVTLHWTHQPQGLRIVDVSFDGDSLVKDYQNQFARVVDKEGAGAALQKLRDRKKQLDEPSAKKAKAR